MRTYNITQIDHNLWQAEAIPNPPDLQAEGSFRPLNTHGLVITAPYLEQLLLELVPDGSGEPVILHIYPAGLKSQPQETDVTKPAESPQPQS